MRPEQLYLLDIVEAAEKIQRFLSTCDQQIFLDNEILQSAILQKLMVIGEAASRLPRPFRERHPEVPWSDVVAFRNIAIHEYFAIDW